MLTARVVRSLTMSLQEREYVTAAKYMGVPGPTIVVRHILPNISSLLIVDATLGVAAAVLAETGAVVLRLRRPAAGHLARHADRRGRRGRRPPSRGCSTPAAIPLVLLVLVVNFIGDGLRDALDPTSQSGGKA